MPLRAGIVRSRPTLFAGDNLIARERAEVPCRKAGIDLGIPQQVNDAPTTVRDTLARNLGGPFQASP
jgi:hypothetical protein